MTTQIDDGQMRVSLYCFPSITERNVIGGMEINSTYQLAILVSYSSGLCINSNDLWKPKGKNSWSMCVSLNGVERIPISPFKLNITRKMLLSKSSIDVINFACLILFFFASLIQYSLNLKNKTKERVTQRRRKKLWNNSAQIYNFHNNIHFSLRLSAYKSV